MIYDLTLVLFVYHFGILLMKVKVWKKLNKNEYTSDISGNISMSKSEVLAINCTAEENFTWKYVRR
jgi:hypothetical protein